MGDEGRNGIADRKHEKPPKGTHFRPRARRACGRIWGPVGGFSCLRSVIPFLPSSPMQKLHFIICIFPEILIPEKIFWTSWSEISLRTGPQNHFRPSSTWFYILKKIFLEEVRIEPQTSWPAVWCSTTELRLLDIKWAINSCLNNQLIRKLPEIAGNNISGKTNPKSAENQLIICLQ